MIASLSRALPICNSHDSSNAWERASSPMGSLMGSRLGSALTPARQDKGDQLQRDRDGEHTDAFKDCRKEEDRRQAINMWVDDEEQKESAHTTEHEEEAGVRKSALDLSQKRNASTCCRHIA